MQNFSFSNKYKSDKETLKLQLFSKKGTLSCTLTKFHVKNGQSKYTNAGTSYAYVINTALCGGSPNYPLPYLSGNHLSLGQIFLRDNLKILKM